MKLSDLAGEFGTLREASGLFLDPDKLTACAIDAARFVHGYGALEDLTAVGLGITGDTEINEGEWTLIAPLFRLYVERETAIAVEASRVMGVEAVGRSSSEVSGEIQVLEQDMQMRAFYEPIESLGIEPDPLTA